MTELMDKAVEAVRKLPADTQNDLARLMINLAVAVPVEIPDDVRTAVEESHAQIARGDRVPEDVMRNFWQQHGV